MGHKVYPETDPSWLLPATFATDFIATAAAAAAVITKFHMQHERGQSGGMCGERRRGRTSRVEREREKNAKLFG